MKGTLELRQVKAVNTESEVERLRRADEIVQSALESWGSEQGALLDEACAGDAPLRAEVESLLNYREQAKDFIETPAFVCGAEWLTDGDGGPRWHR